MDDTRKSWPPPVPPKPNEHLTKSELDRADEINKLFDALEFEKGIRERTVFEDVYGKTDKAMRALDAFLSNVKDCPPEVVEHCRELLASRGKV